MENTRFLIDDHPMKMWASTTQPDRKDGSEILNPYLYRNIPTRILPYIENAEPCMLHNRREGIMLKLQEAPPKQLL